MHDLFGNAYIRKTEPLGIPYMGSKRKYADALISRIMDLTPHAKYFYDICGGGGAMTFAALQKGYISMTQSRKMSLLETIISTAIGYLVAVVTQICVFPLFGINIPLQDNMAIGAIFTVVSIVREYVVRRVFNRIA